MNGWPIDGWAELRLGQKERLAEINGRPKLAVVPKLAVGQNEQLAKINGWQKIAVGQN